MKRSDDDSQDGASGLAALPEAAATGESTMSDKRNLPFKELLEVKDRESFPEQLMKILDEEKAPGAMWWMPDGKAFAIKLDKVAEEVLDKFFQASKYATFTRRLNKWGFRKAPGKPVHLPPKTVVYFHSLFRRDEKELIKHMSDKKIKSKGVQGASGDGSVQGMSSGLSGSMYPSFSQQQAAAMMQQQQQQQGQNLSSDFLLQQMLSGPNAGAAAGGNTGLLQGAGGGSSGGAGLLQQGAGGSGGGAGSQNNMAFLGGNSSIYQLLGNNAGGGGQQGMQGSSALGPIAQFLQQQGPQQQQHQQQQQPQSQSHQNPQSMANTGYHQQQTSLEEFLRYQQQLNQNQNQNDQQQQQRNYGNP